MKRLAGPLAVFVLWMLLFWSLEPAAVVVGLVLAVAVGALLADVFPARMHKALDPRRWGWFLLYLPYFLYFCVRANLDVMFRVIHPDLPIRPGIVKVRTTLTGSMARTFLTSSITLTPGTLTLEIDGQDIYVHWINIAGDPARRTAEICGRFEPLLRRIFQ